MNVQSRCDVQDSMQIEDIDLAPGTYAVVKCLAESFCSAGLTDPARPAEAGGHAAFASDRPMIFAGEMKIGVRMQLLALTKGKLSRDAVGH